MNDGNNQITAYFDMDGVLSVFEPFHGVPLEQKPFMVPGGHYFRHCQPDAHAVAMFQRLGEKPNCVTKVLTRLWPVTDLYDEWYEDKRLWCNEHIPGFDDSRFIAMDKKAEILGPIPPELRRYHVLLDDYNENLQLWSEAGGTAVKYCNGLNTPGSWPGLKVGPAVRIAHGADPGPDFPPVLDAGLILSSLGVPGQTGEIQEGSVPVK